MSTQFDVNSAEFYSALVHFQMAIDQLQMTTDKHVNFTPKELPAALEAGRDGDKKALIRLMDSGVNLTVPNEDGLTCAHFAAKNGHIDVLELLVLFVMRTATCVD